MNKTYCDKCGAEIKNSIYGFKLHPARLQFNDWLNVSQANRNFIGIEKDINYYEVAKQRLSKAKGEEK